MFLRGILAATSLVALLATTSAQIEHGMTCEEREATKPVDTLDLSKLGGVWYELALLKLKGYTDLNPQCSYTQFGPDSSVTTSFRQEKSATWQTMNAHVTTDGTGNMTITYDNIVPGSPEMPFNVVQAAYNDYLIIFGCWGNFFETFEEVHEVAWFLSRTPEPSPEAMAAFNDFREKSEIPWTSEFWTVVNQSSCETADVPTSLGPQQTTDSALQPGTEATAATAVTPQPGTEVTAATEAAPQPMTDKTAATEAAPQPMTDKTAATEATPQPMTDRTAATETLERAMDFLSQNNLLVILAAVFFVTSVSLLVLYHFYRPHPSQRAPSPRAHAASASTTCPEKKVAVLDMWPASSSVV